MTQTEPFELGLGGRRRQNGYTYVDACSELVAKLRRALASEARSMIASYSRFCYEYTYNNIHIYICIYMYVCLHLTQASAAVVQA